MVNKKSYRYTPEEIYRVRSSQRIRRSLFVVLFFLLPLVTVCVNGGLRINPTVSLAAILVCSFFGVFFDRLSSNIENFTIKHQNDLIVVDDSGVHMVINDKIIQTIPTCEAIVVRMGYYAAGQTIFTLKSNTNSILFSTSLDDFMTLIAIFDKDFKWPPESFI